MNFFPLKSGFNLVLTLKIVHSTALTATWISIAADYKTMTFVAIAIYDCFGTYFIAVFVLYARFSNNIGVVLFEKEFFCSFDYQNLLCSEIGPILQGLDMWA